MNNNESSFSFDEYSMLIKRKNNDAIMYLQNHSGKGNNLAKAYLSRAFRDGIGVEKNIDQAITLMNDALKSGVKWTSIELADMLMKRNNIEDCTYALKILYDCISNNINSKHAAYRLSKIYRDGVIVEKDLDLSIVFMKQAIDDRHNIDYIKLLIQRHNPDDCIEACDLLKKMNLEDSKIAELTTLLLIEKTDTSNNYDEAFSILQKCNDGITQKNGEKLIKTLLSAKRFDLLKQIDYHTFCGFNKPKVKINVLLNNNVLCIDHNKSNDETYAEYVIYRDKKAIKTISNVNDRIEIIINDDGVYYVRLNATINKKKFEYCSKTVQYFSDLKRTSLNKLKNDRSVEQIDLLDYYLHNEPYNDFILTNIDSNYDNSIFNVIDKQILSVDGRDVILLCQKDRLLNQEHKTLLFSGSAIINGKYYRGIEDIKRSELLLNNEVGNYTSIFYDGTKIIITTDYFGSGKIYYYLSEEKYIISNNYYLLLLYLKEQNIIVTHNIDVIRSIFYYDSGLLSEQPISYKTVLDKVNLLPAEKKIIIDNRMDVTNSDIAIAYRDRHDYNDDDYDNMVRESAKEIIQNMQALFDSSHYLDYIIDITGGMDSRMVASALSNIKTKKKISACTWGDEKERAIGGTIAKIIGINYDSAINYFRKLNVDAEVCGNSLFDYGNYLNKNMCNELNSFDTSIMPAPFRLNKTLHLGGAFGENYRPYMLTKHYKMDENIDFSEALELYHDCNAWKAMSGYNETGKYFDKCCIEATESSPCCTEAEKCEYVFSSFRSRFHFDLTLGDNISTHSFAPLASKKLFLAFITVMSKEISYKFSFDLLKVLNETISQIEYMDVSNSIMKISLTGDKVLMIDTDTTGTNNRNNAYLSEKDTLNQIRLCNKNHDEYIFIEVKKLFHIMLQCVTDLDDVYLPIWHFIENYDPNKSTIDDKRRMWRLYRKLSLVVYSSINKFIKLPNIIKVNDNINFSIYRGNYDNIIIGKREG